MSKLIVNERPFEVGDEVWSWFHGKGFVGDIVQYKATPVKFVKDMNAKESWFYYLDGCFSNDFRVLFHLDVAQELGFIDMEINVTEPFKPEVGQLYYRPESNEVLEYVEGNRYLLDSGMSVEYTPQHMINAEKMQELDKLNIGGFIHIFSNYHGGYIPYYISEYFYYSKSLCYLAKFGDNAIVIEKNGKGLYSNIQAYRNKHRAERFGGINV